MKKFLLVFLVLFCLTACSLEDKTVVSTAVQSMPTQAAKPTVVPTVAPSPTPTPVPTPTVNPDDAKLENLIASLSTKEKVGQLILARCPAENAAELAAKYNLGGYVLFGRDVLDKTAKEIQANTSSYQKNVKTPMIISVDEEGGTVNRVSYNEALRSSPFMSPREVYSRGGFKAIIKDTNEKCDLLSSLGINVNLAPVCDFSTDPADFIYDRSFGESIELTSKFVATVASAMNKKGFGYVLKHFPGYGNNSDTHTGIAYDQRPIEAFENADFLPFIAGIKAGAPAVLVSHNIVESMDSKYPASLSAPVHKILREDLGFNGVIITDDLEMDAIGDYVPADKAAVLAILAGNDMLCSSDFETQYAAILSAVNSGEIALKRVDDSVRRILKWKLSLNLIN